jgi:hypothetical protein
MLIFGLPSPIACVLESVHRHTVVVSEMNQQKRFQFWHLFCDLVMYRATADSNTQRLFLCSAFNFACDTEVWLLVPEFDVNSALTFIRCFTALPP